jgi:amidase/aspartyl-tRNA(Asn)/glutamyl-tRNA(Gln) amidotransferase subunit A
VSLLPQSVEDWREFTLTRGPRMAAEAFLIKLGALGADEQRAALCGLPDVATLTRRFEAAWPLREAALGGVPFLTKDLYFRAGEPTFAGSTFLPEEIGAPRATSSLPEAFESDAGAIDCGRTQLNEFAFGLTGENPHSGDCPHPTHPGLLSGGSSSGSAFAVARGLVPFALATDTAGSIRVPCGYCGVWGLRLSPDVAPVGDIFPLSPGYDTQGWITRTAKDLRQVSAAVLGEAPPAGAGLWVGDLGLGIPAGDLAAMRAVALKAGAQEDLAASTLLRLACAEAAEAYPVLGGHAAARVHAGWLERRRADYDPVVWERLDAGRRRTYEELRDAEVVRARVADAFRTIFRRHHFIAMPATFGGAVSKTASDATHRRRLLALNAPASLAGLPLVVAPASLPDGLTAGVQFLFPDMANFGWDSVLGRLG